MKPKSGAAKLKASGRHAVMLGVSPEVYAKLVEAAAIEMRSLSGFVIFHASQAAAAIVAADARRRLKSSGGESDHVGE